MAVTPVPAMTAIPPFPALTDRAAGTYNSKAYDFGTHMAVTFNGQLVSVANSAYANAVDAQSSASIAVGAANTAGAIKWVSGTTYAIGDARYSPADLQTYRRRTAGAGTTDPSADTTNWARVTYRTTPTAMTVRTTSGTTVAPAGVTGVTITAVGAGGGSAGTMYQFGGCGGSTVIKTQAAVAGDSFVCVIGFGGQGGGAGGIGGATTINGAATIYAAGGGAGTTTYCNPAGASSGGDIVITGDMGHTGNGSTIYGTGGRSFLGGGLNVGGGGTGYGGGSGGGSTSIGQSGVITFEWIY